MAIIRISELPPATSPVAPSDVLPLLQNGVTKKAQINQLGYTAPGTNAVTRTISNKLGEFLSITDFGAVGDNSTDNFAPFQAAIKAAGDTGIKRIYVPAGTYILQLTGGIGVQDSNNNPINGFEIFGDGDASVLKVGLNSGRDFQAILGFPYTDGAYIHDLCFDFNAARSPLRPTPQTRFHNPAIMTGAGGKNFRVENCSFINCNVDQPIRAASFTTPTPQNQYMSGFVVSNCRFDKFGDGLAGNNQEDISCIYIVGNDVQISNCYWDSGLTTISGSKGNTAIECYGNRYNIFGNIIKNVLTAHIVGNEQGVKYTDNVLIHGNNYFNVNCIVQSIARSYVTGSIEFLNNYVRCDANVIMGNPGFLDSNFLGGGQPAVMDRLTIKNNVFDYEGCGAANSSAYSHLVMSTATKVVEFSGNTVEWQPTGIFYNEFTPPINQNLIFTKNVMRNIRTGATQAGRSSTAFFIEVACTPNAVIFTENHVENYLPKANRTGTNYVGPLVAILFSATGLNLFVANNVVLGANIAVSPFHSAFTSQVTSGNLNGTQTD